MIELIAFGMTFFGFSVSPAATPTSSTAAYANTTPCTIRTIGSTPAGKIPPWAAISWGPGARPSTGCWVTSSTMPMIMKSTSAATLMMANQNSISPNSLTDTRFSVSTTASAINASTHCGTGVKNDQKCA